MKSLISLTMGAVVMAAPFAFAQDVIILGEIHDNPAHHRFQAEEIARISPKAVVYEMLTPQEAERLADVPRKSDTMARATTGFHWSNIAEYSEVLAQSEVIVGAALPSDDVRAAFESGAADVFGAEAQRFGLTDPLPPDQQSVREVLQFAAHCEAMPRSLMTGMVEAQRLRDASFARTVLDTIKTHGAPIVLVTGNGHARSDWGVPFFLRKVAPEIEVAAIAQGEDGHRPEGGFDEVVFAPSIERPDPCDAFK